MTPLNDQFVFVLFISSLSTLLISLGFQASLSCLEVKIRELLIFTSSVLLKTLFLVCFMIKTFVFFLFKFHFHMIYSSMKELPYQKR